LSSYKSPNGINTRTAAYEDFMGVDTSRDKAAMETNKQQHLVAIENGWCDWRGQITRDPPTQKRSGDYQVDHICYFAPNLVAWAELRGSGYFLNSDYGHVGEPNWPSAAVPTSTVFNRRVQMFAQALTPFNYDGAAWRPTDSPALDILRPAFGVAVNRRMAVAGILGKEAEVHISRVDNDAVFPDDEAADSNNALRAGKIDISNILGTSDQITGLAGFEQDLLAIFTSDRALVYKIDPDINLWEIQTRANIQIGCLSHSSIVQAGTDLIFCSRGGVHSLQRSQDNGITVFSQPMSRKIEQLYRKLVRSVPDVRRITAVWDQDRLQYHIFFPIQGSSLCNRLTMSLSIDEEALATGRIATVPKWSTGSAINARCGAALTGRVVLGTFGGVYNLLDDGDEGDDPVMTVDTPIFWQGSLDDYKESVALILQATGSGVIKILAYDDEGRDLGGVDLEIGDQDDDGSFPDLPLKRQYTLPFQRRYRGIQLRFVCSGSGLLRITGFAFVLRK
jgi:hypothetical protein